jgi:hypothetical protein
MYRQIRDKIDELLIGPLFESLRAVDVRAPAYGCPSMPPQEAFRTLVEVGHVAGTPEARYRLHGLDSHLELYVQLNVYRLVTVYRIAAQGTLDCGALQPRFARWAIGAADAGWKVGWRDAIDDDQSRWIEVYCYAALPIDFLTDERHQLYWITDVVQMTRGFLVEARRVGVDLTGTHCRHCDAGAAAPH